MAFTFRPLDGLPEVVRIESTRHGDDRGWFAEVYKESAFRANGIVATFRQANHTMSAEPGTLRGLHYQVAPFAQGKLIRGTAGELLDVVRALAIPWPIGEPILSARDRDWSTLAELPAARTRAR